VIGRFHITLSVCWVCRRSLAEFVQALVELGQAYLKEIMVPAGDKLPQTMVPFVPIVEDVPGRGKAPFPRCFLFPTAEILPGSSQEKKYKTVQ